MIENKPKILVLGSATNLEATFKKFGSHNMLVDYHNPGNFFERVFLCWFPAPKNQVVEIGNNVTVLETKAWKVFKIFTLLPYFLKLQKVLAGEKIDLIRALDPFKNGFLAWTLSRLNGIPFCVSIHSDYSRSYKIDKKTAPQIFGSFLLANFLAKFILKKADMIMIIRESLRDFVMSLGADSKKIRVIPHGIDTKKFLEVKISNFKEEYQIPKNKKIIVSVCRLSKENYVYDILEIAKKIKERSNDIIFLIIGGGNEEPYLKKKAKVGNIDNVCFLGFQSYEKVIKFRKIADINLCLRGGYSLIEAALAGKPIIAYDIDWHYELVKNDETGYLLKEHDIEGIVFAILKLLINSKLAIKYGQNAQEIALNEYSLEKSALIQIQYYKELLGEK